MFKLEIRWIVIISSFYTWAKLIFFFLNKEFVFRSLFRCQNFEFCINIILYIHIKFKYFYCKFNLFYWQLSRLLGYFFTIFLENVSPISYLVARSKNLSCFDPPPSDKFRLRQHRGYPSSTVYYFMLVSTRSGNKIKKYVTKKHFYRVSPCRRLKPNFRPLYPLPPFPVTRLTRPDRSGYEIVWIGKTSRMEVVYESHGTPRHRGGSPRGPRERRLCVARSITTTLHDLHPSRDVPNAIYPRRVTGTLCRSQCIA